MRWRKPRKAILVVSGILYVIFGVLAFFNLPGGHPEHHHTLAHNLTHIVLGLILLGITLRARATTRQSLCFVFAGSYFVIGICGIFAGHHAMLSLVPGIVEFHAGDYSVHLATGLFFLALGLFRRSDRPQPTGVKTGFTGQNSLG